MIEEEGNQVAVVMVVDPCTMTGRIAIQLEADAVVAVPGTAFGTLPPSNRGRLHQICRVQYRGTGDQENQRPVADCE